eukprot:204776-Pyramimonas_sp.AAC.1
MDSPLAAIHLKNRAGPGWRGTRSCSSRDPCPTSFRSRSASRRGQDRAPTEHPRSGVEGGGLNC